MDDSPSCRLYYKLVTAKDEPAPMRESTAKTSHPQSSSTPDENSLKRRLDVIEDPDQPIHFKRIRVLRSPKRRLRPTRPDRTIRSLEAESETAREEKANSRAKDYSALWSTDPKETKKRVLKVWDSPHRLFKDNVGLHSSLWCNCRPHTTELTSRSRSKG